MSAPDPPSGLDRPTPPEAELEILGCLHRLDEATAARLREELCPLRALSHASVSTLLQRLLERGLVVRRKAEHGKSFVYRLTDAAESTFQVAVDRLVERVFAGDRIGFVSSLLGSGRSSREELEQLRDLVEHRLEETEG